MSQTLFGALASLDAHMRRLRRPDSPSNMELGFAIQHIRSVQHRLIELAQRPMP